MSTSNTSRDSVDVLLKLLDLAIPEGDRSRCRGWAPSKGRRCRNPVSSFKYENIKSNRLSKLPLSDHELEQDLSNIAGTVLCYLHGNQSTELAHKWTPLVQKYRRRRQVLADETERRITDPAGGLSRRQHSREETTPPRAENTSTSIVPSINHLPQEAASDRTNELRDQQNSQLILLTSQLLTKVEKLLQRIDDHDHKQGCSTASNNVSLLFGLEDDSSQTTYGHHNLNTTTSTHDTSNMGSTLSQPQTQDCPICTESVTNCRRTPCGHEFCEDCITKWFENQPRLQKDRVKCTTCPVCRRALSLSDLLPRGGPSRNPDELIRDMEQLSIWMKARSSASPRPQVTASNPA